MKIMILVMVTKFFNLSFPVESGHKPWEEEIGECATAAAIDKQQWDGRQGILQTDKQLDGRRRIPQTDKQWVGKSETIPDKRWKLKQPSFADN